MPNNTWDNAIDPHHVARGAAVGPVASITDMTPAPGPILVANELKLGTKLVIEAVGEWTSGSTATTLLLSLWVGTTATVIGASGAITPTVSQTSMPWHLRWNGIVTATGAAGAIYGHGMLDIATANVTTYATGVLNAVPQTAAARATTLNTGQANAVGIAGTWAATTAGNTARCDILNVQILNQGKT